MQRPLESRFLRYLETDLSLSGDAIALALDQHREDLSLLPITLWKYKLVTIEQVSSMFDWIANSHPLVTSFAIKP